MCAEIIGRQKSSQAGYRMPPPDTHAHTDGHVENVPLVAHMMSGGLAET